MKGITGDFLAGIFVVALIYMLVKPGSPASDAVRLFGEAVTSIVGTVTKG